MGSERIIQLQGVGVSYESGLRFWRPRNRWALKDISLEVRRGESIGIIGANGAGKSTLVKVLAGIINPDAGQVIRHTRSTMLLSLRVGMMMHLSGRENAIMSGMMLGMRRREMIAAMDEIIGYAELAEFIDEPIRTYSAGMRARLGFAVACQAKPEVLLLDEVLGVGDAVFRKKSMETMASVGSMTIEPPDGNLTSRS